MSKIIVTGGAGFIGCNFARLALARGGCEIVVLDKLTYAGHLANLADVADDRRLRFVKGDIADRCAVRSLLLEVRPTAIVNFAAESHVDRSIDDPTDFIHTNIVGTSELLEASRLYLKAASADEKQRFRFLHVSTDEVYGSLGPDDKPFTETTPYAPNSPYSASKASADHLVRAYFETFELPVLITNCSNNYGPYQFPEKLIPLIILRALDGEKLPIYGDGSNVRDWIYVDDHCAGILEVLERGRVGEKYNLGGDTERTNLEVVDRICDVLQARHPLAGGHYRELKELVADRPGHDWRYAIDSSKARGELGWQPREDFESGLEKTVRWYSDHREWCRTVMAAEYQGERLGKL